MRRVFYNAGLMVSEHIQMPMDEKFYKRWLVQTPDVKTHEEAFSSPCIAITGHLGNMEFIGGAISYANKKKLKTYTFAKRQGNPYFNRMLEKLRNANYLFQIHTDENIRKIFRLLEGGHILALASDQDAGEKGPYYPFLGRLASTYQGPAFFARITKRPTYFMCSYHNEKGQFVFDVEKLPQPKTDLRDTKEWDREFTYTWVKSLEKKVLLHPSDYNFIYRRWRSQPRDARKVWDFWREWERERGYPPSFSSN